MLVQLVLVQLVLVPLLGLWGWVVPVMPLLVILAHLLGLILVKPLLVVPQGAEVAIDLTRPLLPDVLTAGPYQCSAVQTLALLARAEVGAAKTVVGAGVAAPVLKKQVSLVRLGTVG